MTFIHELCAFPVNFGTAARYSWIPVDIGVPTRPLFAQASYITNLSDLSVSLSAGQITIEDIKISGQTGLLCDVTPYTYIDGTYNAIRVINQNLTPQYNTISIADKNENNVSVFAETSSLLVHQTNPVTAVEITNPVSNVGSSNALDWNIIPVVALSGIYTPLSSFECNLVTVYNSSNSILYIKKTGNAFALPLRKNSAIDISVISNSNEISTSTLSEEITASALLTKY